jgi:hypothetical protein
VKFWQEILSAISRYSGGLRSVIACAVLYTRVVTFGLPKQYVEEIVLAYRKEAKRAWKGSTATFDIYWADFNRLSSYQLLRFSERDVVLTEREHHRILGRKEALKNANSPYRKAQNAFLKLTLNSRKVLMAWEKKHLNDPR